MVAALSEPEQPDWQAQAPPQQHMSDVAPEATQACCYLASLAQVLLSHGNSFHFDFADSACTLLLAEQLSALITPKVHPVIVQPKVPKSIDFMWDLGCHLF